MPTTAEQPRPATPEADRLDAVPSMVRLHEVAGRPGPVLVVHGGAGGRIKELRSREADFEAGLRAAYDAGWQVLAGGGGAVDAVCATVAALEDDPLFNAGRGAALTLSGAVELDACVMAGDGAAGAIAGATCVRNPIRLARVVLEDSPHVLLIQPGADLAREHGLDVVDTDYFVTPERKAQLARILAQAEAPLTHGTVGAAALDADGYLACATSTGGISKQWAGRVGDTPVPGAGSYARDGAVAMSCTGTGEAFLEGCVAHDIYARMAYGSASLPDAVRDTFAAEVAAREATGGVVAVAADGSAVLAHNSSMMLAAFRDGDDIVIWT